MATIEELEKMPLAEILEGRFKGKSGIVVDQTDSKVKLEIYFMIPICPEHVIWIEKEKIRMCKRV